MPKKLHCYVDESGQDTKGRFFVVVCIIAQETLGEIEASIVELESNTERGIRKWHTSRPRNRITYAHTLSKVESLKGHVYARIYAEGTNYLDRTAYTIADALSAYTASRSLDNLPAVVVIDGLKDTEARQIGRVVRRRGTRVAKLRSARDESSVLIRLADSIAGLLRDAHEGNESFKKDVATLKRKGIVTDI